MKSGIIKTILTVINFISVFCTLLSAFGGVFNPEYLSAVPAIAAMTFPVWIVVSIIMMIIDYFWLRRYFWLQVITMAACAVPIYNFCPLGLGASEPTTEQEKRSRFTILTYNTFNFDSYREDIMDFGATLQIILKSDADIVCLQESAVSMDNLKFRLEKLHLNSEILDSIESRYPYYAYSNTAYTIWSKYPISNIITPKLPGTSGSIVNYRVNINGNELSLYSIHLQSIGLNDSDKELYREITKGSARSSDMAKVKSHILSKLKSAFCIRANQAKAIHNIIDIDRSDAILLCGDFNDITGCYAMRQMRNSKLEYDAYTEAGFGPAITYRDSRFYFFIDHILYGGRIKAINADVIYGGASDHLPLLAEFYFKN